MFCGVFVIKWFVWWFGLIFILSFVLYIFKWVKIIDLIFVVMGIFYNSDMYVDKRLIVVNINLFVSFG